MSKIKLKYYDNKISFKENLSFLGNVIKSSKEGFVVAIFLILVLLTFDYISRKAVAFFCISNKNFLNDIADLIYSINDLIGLKFLDYFKDVIVIVASVLGVILGLFFTTFLNIVTSKYSNINSSIVSQLLNQKTINRYFKLLAILVVSSIIYQLLFAYGYRPTFISTSLFTLLVIVTLLAFIFYGRYSLIYFNAGNLASDLINKCNAILSRAYNNKKYFLKDENGSQVLSLLKNNISQVGTIVDESVKPQLENTDLKRISHDLQEFAINFIGIKHTIPSNKNWHLKKQVYRNWEEASDIEYDLYSRLGASLPPETVDDFVSIEKQILNIQFDIIDALHLVSEKVLLIYRFTKYIQIIAFQCNIEIFEYFFDKLEKIVLKNLKTIKNEVVEENVQLISFYSNLMVQYLVGFNYNLTRIIKTSNLIKLAKHVHLFQDTDKVMNFPYATREWMDEYQVKLKNENFNENKILTPYYYTEFELGNQIQHSFKSHFKDVSEKMHDRVINFAVFLKKEGYNLESLEFLSESLEIYNKISFFSDTLKNTIENEIQPLNLKKEEPFNFNEHEELAQRNEIFKEKCIKEIWELGYSSYSIKNKDLPDIFGNFYQLICEDIFNKALKKDLNQLIEYIPKFYTYNILYLEHLRSKIKADKFEIASSKLYPIIVDLFEISSIIILLFKGCQSKKLEDSFFDYWGNSYWDDDSKEKSFWSIICLIYFYFSQPIFGLSTPSFREQKRIRKFEEFLKRSDWFRLEEVESAHMPFMRHYVCIIDDIYLQEIARHLTTDELGGLSMSNLSEIFIEFFLRTRILLKDLKIKETRYGEDIRYNMERDT